MPLTNCHSLLQGDHSDLRGMSQLQCSREVYQAVQQAWNLPLSTLRTLFSPRVHTPFRADNKIGATTQLLIA